MSLLPKNGSVNHKNGSVNHSEAPARAPQTTPLVRFPIGTRAILLAQTPFAAPLPSAIESPSDPAPTLEWLNPQRIADSALPDPERRLPAALGDRQTSASRSIICPAGNSGPRLPGSAPKL
jgi:hypothetical protein